jgi:glycosyltransferase involved in cell wall biosynthesis
VVAGDGPQRSVLVRESRDIKNVVFTGFLSATDKIDWYKQSDFFVFVSEGSEGMPTVLLEAMAAGLPIISTKVAGATEIIQENFGTSVERGNSTELANAILRFATCGHLSEMGTNASRCATAYDWSVIVRRVLDVWESSKKREPQASRMASRRREQSREFNITSEH